MSVCYCVCCLLLYFIFSLNLYQMKKIPGCKLFLGDRPIQITIARAFQSLSVYELGQVLYHLTTSNPKPLEYGLFFYIGNNDTISVYNVIDISMFLVSRN